MAPVSILSTDLAHFIIGLECRIVHEIVPAKSIQTNIACLIISIKYHFTLIIGKSNCAMIEDDSSNTFSDDYSSEESSEDALETGKIDFTKDITTIEGLKFQNTLYKAGDHIALRADPNDKHEIYARILLIGQAPQVDFPLIYVAWHYSRRDGFEDAPPSYLSDRELVASNHKEWQYIESITRKIQVISLKQFEQLEYKARENPDIFFMRSYLDPETKVPTPSPDLVCHCLRLYNPDEKLNECCSCKFKFHLNCSRNQYLCLNCQSE